MAAERFRDPSTIRKILGYARSIAVVGPSSKPDRPCTPVARYLGPASQPVAGAESCQDSSE